MSVTEEIEKELRDYISWDGKTESLRIYEGCQTTFNTWVIVRIIDRLHGYNSLKEERK